MKLRLFPKVSYAFLLSLVSTQGCSSSAATSTASRHRSHLLVYPGGCCRFSGISCFGCFHKPKAKPLKIITGRGKHSLNQVGVLKPAVRKALVEDGWSVGSWDGGLVVRQRQI